MAAGDAVPVPRKNTAFRVTFPILDADGDLVTGATGLDSEVSLDGGTFADCTNEATEIATSSGMYYLDLTAAEMNADTVAIIVKTSSSGAKTTPIVLYPEEAGDYRANTTHIAGAAVSTSSAQIGVNVVNAGGTAWGSGAITAASIAADAITAAKIADGAIDAGAIAADAITAAKVAADVSAEIADAVWDEARAGHVTAGSFGEGVASVQGNVTGNVSGSVASIGTGGIAAAAFAAGAIDAAAIAADAIGASELATDAVNEIRDAVANLAMVEPSAVPAVTASLKDTLSWILALSRNKITQTATTQTLRNDADSGTIATAAVSDDGTTFTRAEWA